MGDSTNTCSLSPSLGKGDGAVGGEAVRGGGGGGGTGAAQGDGLQQASQNQSGVSLVSSSGSGGGHGLATTATAPVPPQQMYNDSSGGGQSGGDSISNSTAGSSYNEELFRVGVRLELPSRELVQEFAKFSMGEINCFAISLKK